MDNQLPNEGQNTVSQTPGRFIKMPIFVVIFVVTVLGLALGFYLYRQGALSFKQNNINIDQETLNSLGSLNSFDPTLVIISATIEEIRGNTMTLKNSKGQLHDFPLDKDTIVWKKTAFNSPPPYESSDINQIPLGKNASQIDLVKEGTSYKIVNIIYHPN